VVKYERHSVKLLGEIAGHRYIPGMRMDDVDALKRLDLGQVQAERLQRSLEFAFSSLGDFAPRLRAADMEVCLIGVLSAPAMDFDLNLRASSRLR
jgi:hypothetical protein